MESTRLGWRNATMIPNNTVRSTLLPFKTSFISGRRLNNGRSSPIRWLTQDVADKITQTKASVSKSTSNPLPEVPEPSNNKLKSLADSLLNNAASFLGSNRKTAYCITCQGTGIVDCAACQGSGILAPEKVAKMNTMKHAVHKVSQMISKDTSTSMYDQDWIKTNRCKR